jgi:hypothetical protein
MTVFCHQTEHGLRPPKLGSSAVVIFWLDQLVSESDIRFAWQCETDAVL